MGVKGCLLVQQHCGGEVRLKMTVDSDEEVLETTDVSVEFMRKVEILLILMSFIFAMLLVFVIISIIMIYKLCLSRKRSYSHIDLGKLHHERTHQIQPRSFLSVHDTSVFTVEHYMTREL